MSPIDVSTMSRPRLVHVALACAALVVAGTSPASAVTGPSATVASTSSSSEVPDDHRVVHLDARADVRRLDLETDKSSPDPGNRASDITKTVVDHQADQVFLQTRVRELKRSGYRLMIATLVVSDGRRFEFDVDYSLDPIGPRISLMKSKTGSEVECPDASWSIDRSRDRVTGTVPTSCLGDPAWIRVGIGIVGGSKDLRAGWADDSRTAGRLPELHPTLGPRQHRAE